MIPDRYEDLYQFGIIQKKIGLIEVHVATDDEYLRSIREGMLKQLHERISPDIRFEIIRVDKIDPDPSGKIRMLISEVEFSA